MAPPLTRKLEPSAWVRTAKNRGARRHGLRPGLEGRMLTARLGCRSVQSQVGLVHRRQDTIKEGGVIRDLEAGEETFTDDVCREAR